MSSKNTVKNIEVKILDEHKTKAIVNINFGDFIIKGFRINRSHYQNYKGDPLWVNAPSQVGSDGKYHNIFFAPDKEWWGKLERQIWDAFYEEWEYLKRKREEGSRPRSGQVSKIFN